jgi:hypothetical protein
MTQFPGSIKPFHGILPLYLWGLPPRLGPILDRAALHPRESGSALPVYDQIVLSTYAPLISDMVV